VITLYHLNHSRSDRIIWLMEELGEPYERVVFDRLSSGLAPPEYRALHPVGTSPIIRDGDLVLMETGAIIEYIVNRYGRGRLAPEPASRDYGLYLQWLHFAEASAALGVMIEANLRPTMIDGTLKPGRAQVWHDRNDRILAYLDQELSQRPYIVGESFTAADIMMASNISMFEAMIGRTIAAFKHVTDYSARVFGRPAYIRATEIAYPDGRRAATNPFARREG
jgi:glutathione S-transferase